MKNLLKYIYIIGMVGLMGFWSQDVLAACDVGFRDMGSLGCIPDPLYGSQDRLNEAFKGLKPKTDSLNQGCAPDRYYRSSSYGCFSKLCIGHSDGYCKAVEGGTSQIDAKKTECMGGYRDKDGNSSYKQKGDEDFCDCISKGGTELAVAIPFVGSVNDASGKSLGKSDRCIPKAASGQALPLLIGVIIQILNTVLLVGGFAMLVYAGVLRTMQQSEKDLTLSKNIMRGVFGAFALYGSLGMILKLINPVLFG